MSVVEPPPQIPHVPSEIVCPGPNPVRDRGRIASRHAAEVIQRGEILTCPSSLHLAQPCLGEPRRQSVIRGQCNLRLFDVPPQPIEPASHATLVELREGLLRPDSPPIGRLSKVIQLLDRLSQ